MKYDKNTFYQIKASNKLLISVIGLSLLLAAPAYAINPTENSANPDIDSLSNSPLVYLKSVGF